MITVNNDVQLDFSVESYLSEHLLSHFEEADGTWIKGTCLFHDDHSPSMYVDTVEGGYICFSCGARGNVVRLVQRVSRFPTYYDALEWLTETYGVGVETDDAGKPFTLRFTEVETLDVQIVDSAIADRYTCANHAYMTEVRGIPAWVLRDFNVGYDAVSHSVTIPWYTRQGQLLTVKHRAIDEKRFYYEPRCKALRHNVYGLHRCIGADVVYMCEAEIDALTLWGAGKRAVAIGGSHVNEVQMHQIRLAGVQVVVPTCDRDQAGADANERVAILARQAGIDVYQAVWPRDDVKDANDLGVDGCRQLTYEFPQIIF